MMQISRRWIHILRQSTIPIPTLPVTLDAFAFALKHGFSTLHHLLAHGDRIGVRTRFCELICRDSRLHHVHHWLGSGERGHHATQNDKHDRTKETHPIGHP
jgi:hypothetical protein